MSENILKNRRSCTIFVIINPNFKNLCPRILITNCPQSCTKIFFFFHHYLQTHGCVGSSQISRMRKGFLCEERSREANTAKSPCRRGRRRQGSSLVVEQGDGTGWDRFGYSAIFAFEKNYYSDSYYPFITSLH